jgi:hypothetical protein
VRLDPVDHHDAVRSERGSVAVDAVAAGGRAYLDRLHRRHDGTADARLVDAVAGQHLVLAIARRTAVGAHRRHDERLAAALSQPVGDGARHFGDAVDAAAAGRYRHSIPRLEARGYARHVERGAHGRRRVRERVIGEVLANEGEPRNGRSGGAQSREVEVAGKFHARPRPSARPTP